MSKEDTSFVDIPIAIVTDEPGISGEELLFLRTTSTKESTDGTEAENDDETAVDDGMGSCVVCYYNSDDEDDYESDTEKKLTQKTLYNSHRYAQLYIGSTPVCSHKFHTVCLYKWISSSREFICPYCKQSPLSKNNKLDTVPELFPSKPEYIVEYYPDGKVKTEYFKENGQLNGMYKRKDPNQYPTYECMFENDKRHGTELIYHANTDKLFKSQQYHNGLKNGIYEERDVLGNVIKIEEYKNNVNHGISEERYLATLSKKHIVVYQNGLKHGIEKVWTIDGKLIFYKPHHQGIGRGRCIARFPDNGHIERKCFYNDNGQLHGYYIEFQYLNTKNCLSNKEDDPSTPKTDTTLLKRAHYNDGNYTGKYEEYHNNGTLHKLAEYDENGKKDGEYFEYNRFGQCLIHYRYRNDMLDGWCERYNDEGKIQEQAYYTQNTVHGIYKQFHPNGRTKISQTFNKGIAHGETIFYSQSGNPIGKYMYVNGKCAELDKSSQQAPPRQAPPQQPQQAPPPRQ